ncbi:hypothetical protein P43SY_010647 [Pythium insidiosum]|uniref:Uncharacterized protein n=1 Tax=Pythium insidiosum TaxID=114742 RepID=A0AAD5LQI7_PYTIN|nr:hypothetical protein P43SY_010647 [Pythium insidiosum]
MDEERMELELQHVEDVFWMRHDAGDVHVAGEMWEEVVVEAAEWLLQQWRTSRVALQQTLPLAVFHMFDSATRLEMRGPIELMMEMTAMTEVLSHSLKPLSTGRGRLK